MTTRNEIELNHPAGSRKDGRTHILFVIDQLGRRLGGAERTLFNMVRFLPKDKFRCSVLTFAIVGDPSSLRDLPCPLVVLPLKRTYDLNAMRMVRKFLHILHSQEVKIVHTLFESSDIWAGFWAKIGSSVPVVSSRRDMGILRGTKHRIAYRLLGSWFDKVLVVSDEVRRFSIESDKLDPAKVLTIYNGVDLEQFSLAKPELRTQVHLDGKASQVVTTVGNIRRIKGTDVFVRAAAKVLRLLPDTKFIVVGDIAEGDYFLELQELCQELNLGDKIHFVGGMEEIFDVLRQTDIFCLLSRSEGFSNALLEAMAAGLPAVVTNVGGNAEAVEEGQTGFLVPRGDDTQAADRILSLLRNREHAKQMGDAARSRVERKFSCQAMIDQLVEVYQSLLSAKAPGS